MIVQVLPCFPAKAGIQTDSDWAPAFAGEQLRLEETQAQ